MAGRGPAIHDFHFERRCTPKNVNARHKAGHDVASMSVGERPQAAAAFFGCTSAM